MFLFAAYFFITIMLTAVYGPWLPAQQITTQAPPGTSGSNVELPDAVPLTGPIRSDSPVIESSGSQSYAAGVFTLERDVVITFGNRRIEADRIVYDTGSGELTLTGHLLLSGGPNGERLSASHGTYNSKTQTGTFYDVTGSVGLTLAPDEASHRNIYTTSNPFTFTGRMVVKTGARNYDIYDGTLTSCRLPRPDWLLTSAHLSVDPEKAHARNSTFRLLNVPVLFFPYVTHPLDARDRQSGLLTPTVGQYDKNGTRGIVFGEQIYLVLGRSADLILGADYYTSIGFAQNAQFRFRGAGHDFLTIRYNGLLDRRIGTGNQGGEDAVIAGRLDFTDNTRIAGNLEYLSSYIYREAFSNTFNQAVTSDIISTAYLTHHARGVELAAMFDRYQGIKLIAQGSTPQQQVRIFHAPALSVATTEHRIPRTPLVWSVAAEAAGLKRTQPNFATGGIVERFDFRPRLALPLHLGSWQVEPAVGFRETLYSRSRVNPVQGQPPRESLASLSRDSFDVTLQVRPPVLTRTFVPSRRMAKVFGDEVRHTIEPEFTYRLTKGVSNFANILRFDETDVVSNTNEAEFGMTQRLFRRTTNKARPCRMSDEGGLNPEDAAASTQQMETCRNEELISWRLTQKYFFDPGFGHVITNGRRNILETTLNFSGIAFLTEPREISPLLSRLRVRTSASTDVEWDFDLDTGARKFTSSNVFVDYHHGNAFTALSYARLDAPGRFFTAGVTNTSATGVTSLVSDFNQLRYLIGYGSPVKPGLSIAANTGLDLKALYGTTSTMTNARGVTSSMTVYPALFQYAAAQVSYNWNCCGLSVEYRKFELGSVRNENSYRFNFTLANIGSAGNLRKAERLF